MGIELFERAAESRGRVLKVEQLASADASGADPDPGRGAGYLLTLDVGRILVAADRNAEQLAFRHVESAADIESIKLFSLDEEEPWWRVIGNPLTRAWPVGAGAGAASGAGSVRELRLQFREDAENPKLISLRYEAGTVRVSETEEVGDGR